jgi:hypothetical protein
MLTKCIYRYVIPSHCQFYNYRSLSVDLLTLFLVMNLFLLHISSPIDELKDSTEMKWQLHDSEKLK